MLYYYYIKSKSKKDRRGKPARPGKQETMYNLFDENRTRCGYNNSKVCAPTMSTMPGTAASLAKNAPEKTLAIYSDMIQEYSARGLCTTCAHDCPGCYAMALKAYPAVFEKYLLNTIELYSDPVRFYALVEKELFADPYTAPRVVRIHEAGEFTGSADIAAFIAFAARHAETIFFGYSKDERIQDLQRAGTLPKNVRFACSPWILADGTVLCAPVESVYQYIYNDGTNPALDKVVKCPCSNPDGTSNKDATCVKCGRCVRCKDGDKTAVFPHGVSLANSWLAGRARLYMKDFSLDYAAAAAAAYQDAMKQARPTWAEKAASDLESRVKKLSAALKKADRDAAKKAVDILPAAAD